MRRFALLFAAPFLGLALCVFVPLLGWVIPLYFVCNRVLRRYISATPAPASPAPSKAPRAF